MDPYTVVNGPQAPSYAAPLVNFSALSGGQQQPQQQQNPGQSLGQAFLKWLQQYQQQQQQQQQPGAPMNGTPTLPLGSTGGLY